MILIVALLLGILVGGYVGYPLFVKETERQQTYSKEELREIEEEIEQEILVLRKHPENTTP